jgi:signal transduction histidine kinase
MGMAQILYLQAQDQAHKEHCHIILQSSEHLLILLNDILDLAKAESDQMELENIPFNISNIAEELTQFFLNKANEKKLNLVVRLGPTMPLQVIGDATRVKQILSILISNAIQFTKEGQIILDIDWQEIADGKNIFIFKVCDTGIGIAKDKFEKIFDKYTRADISTTRDHGGTGNGLNICFALAQRMGGSITLESQVGVGSEFSLRIPLLLHKDVK